jgi:hypothetical protein
MVWADRVEQNGVLDLEELNGVPAGFVKEAERLTEETQLNGRRQLRNNISLRWQHLLPTKTFVVVL